MRNDKRLTTEGEDGAAKILLESHRFTSHT